MSRVILAVETATDQVGVALGDAEGVVASFHLARERLHAETLIPAVELVCRQGGVGVSDIEAIAVDRGPGLFTGLRVGIATAKAIAFAGDLFTIGVCSLDLLAYPARITSRRVVSMIDARCGVIYHASYQWSTAGMMKLTEPQADTPHQVAETLATLDENCLLVGTGARRYSHLFEDIEGVTIADGSLAFPRADSLIALADEQTRDHASQSSELVPLYLEPPPSSTGP